MAPAEYNPKVYIHLIRHGQAEHNYRAIQRSKDPNYKSANKDENERQRCKQIKDASLTAHGMNEAFDLRHRFPYMDDITHIVTSPLRRALQTTLIVFKHAIDRGVRPIALDSLRERGFRPCNFGTDLAVLLREFGELGEIFLTQEIRDGWEQPPEETSESKFRARADYCRQRLKALGELSKLSLEDRSPHGSDRWITHWDNMYELPGVEKGKDIHIAVVSHDGLLKRIIKDTNGDSFGNAEFRTYTFENKELVAAGRRGRGDGDSAVLVETEESLSRVHQEKFERDFKELPWAVKDDPNSIESSGTHDPYPCSRLLGSFHGGFRDPCAGQVQTNA